LAIESQQAMSDALVQAFPDNDIEGSESSNVNPAMGKEFFLKCLVAVAAASLIIVIYVGIRFRKIGGISAGAMSIVALLHDVLIVFAVFVFFRMPLDDNFIAVVLTILGFSINDTIVIYDRIRENERLYSSKRTIGEIVNMSINQSLSRSINTTLCGLLVMGSVCVVALIYGVTSILTFALPMVFGMISGAYSSICIAGPLWVVWKNYRAKKDAVSDKNSKPRNSGGVGKIRI
ncbi:MAG: protein translocase subunit SecF, partial [Acetanaerobacterium sp.]